MKVDLIGNHSCSVKSCEVGKLTLHYTGATQALLAKIASVAHTKGCFATTDFAIGKTVYDITFTGDVANNTKNLLVPSRIKELGWALSANGCLANATRVNLFRAAELVGHQNPGAIPHGRHHF